MKESELEGQQDFIDKMTKDPNPYIEKLNGFVKWVREDERKQTISKVLEILEEELQFENKLRNSIIKKVKEI